MSRVLVVLASVALAACSQYSQPLAPDPAPLGASNPIKVYTQNESIPLTIGVWIACAAGGAGEFVTLEGNLHVLTQVSSDGGGGFHVQQHYQPQGVTGVGSVTGDKYQATGITRYGFTQKAGYTETYVNNFRIIGQGPENNYLVHETFHITINADGTVKTSVDHFTSDCK
jgi:hypothetical protein